MAWNVKVSEKLMLTKSYLNSYGTDYVNVPTSRAPKISEPVKFPVSI